MEKQILKAVEEAYRKGSRDAKGLNDITPFLLTSQVVANKFCQPLVGGQFCRCTGLMEIEKVDGLIWCIKCRKRFISAQFPLTFPSLKRPSVIITK